MFTDPPTPALVESRQAGATLWHSTGPAPLPTAGGDNPSPLLLRRNACGKRGLRGVLFAHFEYAYSFFFSTALSIRHNFLLIGTFLRPNNNFFNNFFAHLIIQFLCNAVALHVNFITPRRAFDMNN